MSGSVTSTTPMGLKSFVNLCSQGSRATRQPWALLHNRFAVRNCLHLVLGVFTLDILEPMPTRAVHAVNPFNLETFLTDVMQEVPRRGNVIRQVSLERQITSRQVDEDHRLRMQLL